MSDITERLRRWPDRKDAAEGIADTMSAAANEIDRLRSDATQFKRNLLLPKDQRLMDAAEALMAACYDPLTFPGNWSAYKDLGPMAADRVMKIVALACANIINQDAPGSVQMHEAGYPS